MSIHTLLLDLFGSIALISAAMVIVSKNPIHSVVFLILVFCNAAGLLVLLKIEFIAMMFLIIYVGAIAVLFLFVVMMLNIKMNELSQNENWLSLRYLPIGGVISAIFLLEIFFGVASMFPAFGENCCLNETLPFGQQTIGNAQPSGAISPVVAGMSSTLDSASSLREAYFLCLDPVGPMTCGNVQKRWTGIIDSVSNIQSLGLIIYTYYFYYFLMSSLILLVAMIGAIVLTMHKRRNAAKKQLIFRQVGRNFEEAIGYADSSLP